MGWKVVHLTKPCKIKVKNEKSIEEENEPKQLLLF